MFDGGFVGGSKSTYPIFHLMDLAGMRDSGIPAPEKVTF